MESEEVLVGLERFLTEFFHLSTSNQRKREIEEQLSKFGSQTGSWKHCLYVFTKSQNEYVLMYCLSVLENLVNKMWIGFDPTFKAEIRSNLNQVLLLQHKTLPLFITHKLIKVIVDIGRVDWPMFYPEFFTSLLQLASSSAGEQFGDTRAIGLASLRIASEELISPREDISVQRKEELKKLLLSQVPDIIKVITNTLRTEWVKCFEQFAQMSMATPPPSPNAGQNNLFDLFTPVEQNILPKLTSSIDISDQSFSIMTQSLECLCHLFSWIPLTSNITPDLLSVVFQYARLGCCINSQSASLSMLSTLGSHAMTCINELLSKNCVPQNFEDFLIRIFRQIFHILQQLTKGDNPRAIFENLDDNYLEKFIEFLRLFVSTHFSRIEANSSFPLLPFLTLLYKFTFNQNSNEHYLNCLDIWEIFVDYVVTKTEQGKGNSLGLLHRYKEGMIAFASATFQHIQFRYNRSQLNDLDDSTCDENGHTEWETYVIENLEVFSKICNLFPTELISVLYIALEDTATAYMSTDWPQVAGGDAQNINRLHCILRDLTTTLQAFGRISDLFLTEHFHQRFNNALILVKKLLSIAVYGSQHQLYGQSGSLPSVLANDATEILAGVLAALQPYTHWLAQLYSEAQQAGHSQAQLSEFLNSYVDVVIPVLTKQVPNKVVFSASHTLLSVVNTVRATFLSQSTAIEKLFNDVTNGACNKLQYQTQYLIYKALSNLLLLPWPNTPELEQKWQPREKSHHDFIASLLSDYLALQNKVTELQNNEASRDSAKQTIHRALLISVELIEAISDEVIKTRQICFASFQQTFLLAMDIYPFFLNYPDTTEVFFSFFLSMFSSLRRQIGVEGITRTIQSFISKFSHEQLQHIILHENVAGVRVVEKLLKILTMVVIEPGNSFKSFTPSIIVFAIEQIYPIVSERSSPEVKGAIFDLLRHVLLRRYRYFFPSQMIASMLVDGTLNSKAATISHKPQFLSIMSAFGNAFLQPDITIFKQTLDVLENLNQKLKLYYKLHIILTEEKVLFQFINVLLQVLINKSHDLLQEDICSVVFNMAATDFDFFYGTFMQQFLQNSQYITEDQKSSLFHAISRVADLPSFSANLYRFVNDLRYYRICNSSLPDGTVRF